jgi:hypothetical protein
MDHDGPKRTTSLATQVSNASTEEDHLIERSSIDKSDISVDLYSSSSKPYHRLSSLDGIYKYPAAVSANGLSGVSVTDIGTKVSPTASAAAATAAAAILLGVPLTKMNDNSTGNLRNNSIADGSAPTLNNVSDLTLIEAPAANSEPPRLAPSSSYFPVELHPSQVMCDYYAGAVSDIIGIVEPTSSELKHRWSINAMVRKQARLSLNCNTFATGLHDILCSLPDDSIHLTVILNKSLLSSWHSTLIDRFNTVNERIGSAGAGTGAGSAPAFPEEDEQLSNLPGPFNSYMAHVFSNITHVKLNTSVALRFDADGPLKVEVLANNSHDICILAFLEEMSSLVGQDSLFKRSILLIRAWWVYETAAYVGTHIKPYIGDISICVMVCAVFNQYHARISSPLQALCLFLAEYSAYDGATHAITLQGIVPFKSSSSSQPVLLDSQPWHLLSCDCLEKYWQLMNVNGSSYSDTASDYEPSNSRTSSAEDSTAAAAAANAGRATSVDSVSTTTSSHGSPTPPPPSTAVVPGAVGDSGSAVPAPAPISSGGYRSGPGGIEKSTMKNLSAHNLHYFERHTFNIVHPFNHTNMVVEKLSPRRQMRLNKAFQIGATELTVYLRQSTENKEKGVDLLNYFPTILTKFGKMRSKKSMGE